MRKKKHPEHVNHERWLVSYADFITLLFAFFVVMFAVSQVDGNKVGRMSQSFQEAFGTPIFTGGQGMFVTESGPPKEPEEKKEPKREETPKVDLQALKGLLEGRLNAQDPQHNFSVMRRRQEIVLRLPDRIWFESGDDRLKPAASRILLTVADQIRDLDVDLRVEGHTDDRPIHSSRWRSNWELSSGRAAAVVEELSGPGALPPERLSAAGYGEFHPIASNATEEGRLKNRRVDIVILPNYSGREVIEGTESGADSPGEATSASGRPTGQPSSTPSAGAAEAAPSASAQPRPAPSAAAPAGPAHSAAAHSGAAHSAGAP